VVEAKVRLAVPKPKIGNFPESVKPHLETPESFIGDIRLT
jgi:hypothetical protein